MKSPASPTARTTHDPTSGGAKDLNVAYRTDGTRKFEFSLNLQGDLTVSARKAEDLGFDYVHAGEHLLFHHGVGMNAMIQLAAAAAVTTRIRLVSAITYVPLYQSAILAWLASSLDRISRGRFEMGVGVGGEYPPELELAGIDKSQRGARTDETLDMLRRLWNEEQVTFEGRFNHFHNIRWQPDTRLQPQPAQTEIPIWIGGRKHAAMRRAARYGDGWMPYMLSTEKLADSIRTVRDEAEQLNRDPDTIKTGIATAVTVYPDSAKAKRVAAETASATYDQDLRHIVDRYLIAGSPDECRARLRAYHDAGARTAFIALACPTADTQDMQQLLVNDVLPEFRGTNAGEPNLHR